MARYPALRAGLDYDVPLRGLALLAKHFLALLVATTQPSSTPIRAKEARIGTPVALGLWRPLRGLALSADASYRSKRQQPALAK